ncbi:MAG: site-specific DNA-methyltransferase [Acidimicrobiia bacterium]|nr:MAG: site-specific DNA-methyltransferase [Acidimicrobiia bacterium]
MATSTASFGTGKREGHDSSGYYGRRMHAAGRDREVGELVDPPASVVDHLFHGSSESMHQIPDNCVALMVTSPPYNVGKDYDEDLDIDEYLQLLNGVFTETFRVLEPGGRVAVNVANLGRKPYIPLNQYVSALLTEIGFDLRGEIIWQKAKSAGGSCAWGSWQSAKNPTLRDIHEYVIVASKGSYARVRRGEDTISKDEFLDATVSIWNILPESARRVGHPAPFPVELPRRLIELYTFEADLVLDPFLGSGTTAVAAVESRRHYVGYELDAGYIDIAERRIHEGRTGTRSVHL